MEGKKGRVFLDLRVVVVIVVVQGAIVLNESVTKEEGYTIMHAEASQNAKIKVLCTAERSVSAARKC